MLTVAAFWENLWKFLILAWWNQACKWTTWMQIILNYILLISLVLCTAFHFCKLQKNAHYILHLSYDGAKTKNGNIFFVNMVEFREPSQLTKLCITWWSISLGSLLYIVSNESLPLNMKNDDPLSRLHYKALPGWNYFLIEAYTHCAKHTWTISKICVKWYLKSLVYALHKSAFTKLACK